MPVEYVSRFVFCVCFSLSFCLSLRWSFTLYRVAKKSKPPPIFQKIVLKIANEIRFLRKVEI